MKEPIKTITPHGEEEHIYADGIKAGIKITFAKKRRTDMFIIPWDRKQEFIKLINDIEE